jgi:hydroxyacyl-ACP dehydratase HTD2-like protein with hotdog domain
MPARDHIGLTGPDYDVAIERGKIREFARAMQAPLDDFCTGKTPVVPPTFFISVPYTWGYTLERPRGTVFEGFDHDLSVPLHAEEEFIYHGCPPRAGDQLTARTSLENVVEKHGRHGGDLTFLTMLTEYRNSADDLVVEQRSVTVTTSRSPADDEWKPDVPDYSPDYGPDLDPVDPFAALQRVSWDALTEGEGPGEVDTGPLLIRDIVRFMGVVGEDNALHYDIAWAHSKGYPAVFGLGMHQASVLASYAVHWIDPKAVRRFKAKFRAVSWPGDRMLYSGVVVRKYKDAQGCKSADFTLTCRRPDGTVVAEVDLTCVYEGHCQLVFA